jgi:hypothetical protein
MVSVPNSVPPRIMRFRLSPIHGISLAAFVPAAVAKYER